MNDGMTRATKLLQEHKQCGRLIDDLDRRSSLLQSQMDALDQEMKAIERRQDAIADELAPSLRRGPLEWWDGKDKCVVRLNGDRSITIEPIQPAHAWTTPMRPRMFSDHELVEAAMYAVFSDEDDDTCEIISLPGRRVAIKGNAG